MSEVDIHDPIELICERFGIRPEDVAELTIKPRSATALVFKRNERGSAYIDSDTNEAASETLEFKVKT